MPRPQLPGWVASLLGAIVFFTAIPLPRHWPIAWEQVARWAPWIGIAIGGIVAGLDVALAGVGMPPLARSALLVAVWLALTGGLHLDGAMDAADGLAATDPQRRLAVMADSTTGAFGVMAAIVLLGFKTLALSELTAGRSWALMAAAGWGRWGLVAAIAGYPYLKAAGKGAFHRPALRLPQDLLLGLAGLLVLGGLGVWQSPGGGWAALAAIPAGAAIAAAVGAWFAWRLGGHTGDTYGAVVEWTEALLLGALTVLYPAG
ncbi:MAG: adenosylcobinamide-GDP ribazoletransferase [Cyanobacteria bacterium QS_8_64_29]|nr:MAG: adenosylcobinamide-GDP ribazoletransferase [Cyanobacteria bacterium QS_8_64_29]